MSLSSCSNGGSRMGFKWKMATKKTINIFISDHVIRLLESKQSDLNSIGRSKEKYLPYGLIEEGKIQDQEQYKQLLLECVKEWQIKGENVQFLVPDPVIVVRKIEIPDNILESEIQGYLYLELGSTIHLPFDNPIFNYEVLGVQEGKKEILLFAAPEPVVQEYAKVFEDVGLKPIVADISPLALYRLYYKLSASDTDEAVLSIQFNLQTVTASIFKKHKLIFVRQLKMNISIDQWSMVQNEQGQQALSWKEEEQYLHFEIQEMLEEVERIINFYQYSLNKDSEEGIPKILLTGDHPYLEEIKMNLEKTVEDTVHTLHHHSILQEDKQVLDGSYYVLAGLALKGGI